MTPWGGYLPISGKDKMTIKKDYLEYENKKKTIKKRLLEITKLLQNHRKFCRSKRGKKKKIMKKDYHNVYSKKRLSK